MLDKQQSGNVKDAFAIDPSTNELIVATKTLTDSGINMAITGEEARGGQGRIH